jgi:dTDP-4-amino-4,6-dideoxygalactose transaminase
VIEDNAHGLGAHYRGRPLGSIGALAAQSFHATKNIQCGEGGALMLNDDALRERAEILREKGTDRSRFFRGQVDKYRWMDVGSSYLPSDVLAAGLTAQLESFAEIQRRRHAVWDAYHAGLAEWAAEAGVRRPVVPTGCEHVREPDYYLLLHEPGSTARRCCGTSRARCPGRRSTTSRCMSAGGPGGWAARAGRLPESPRTSPTAWSPGRSIRA